MSTYRLTPSFVHSASSQLPLPSMSSQPDRCIYIEELSEAEGTPNRQVLSAKDNWHIVRSNLSAIVRMGMGTGSGSLSARTPGRGAAGNQSRLTPRMRWLRFWRLWKLNRLQNGSKPKMQLPSTKNESFMQAALPFLPVPLAVVCCFYNVIMPGSGTLSAGLFGLCFGRPRIRVTEWRRAQACLVCAGVACAQFGTVSLCGIGWIWSITWGGLIIMHAQEYRKAQQEFARANVVAAVVNAHIPRDTNVMLRQTVKHARIKS